MKYLYGGSWAAGCGTRHVFIGVELTEEVVRGLRVLKSFHVHFLWRRWLKVKRLRAWG